MPRTCTGSIADRRATISLAALLVKVTARILPGLAWPFCSSQAMRVVSTPVLPHPPPPNTRPRPRQEQRMAGRRRHGGELLGVQMDQKGGCGRWGIRERVLWEHAAIVESTRRNRDRFAAR